MQDDKQNSAGVTPTRTFSTALWMGLIASGMVFEFAGRFLGYRDNPSGLWIDFAPLLTTVAAATIIISAVFKLISTRAEKNLGGFRNALLLLLLGSAMLVGSMACKNIVGLIF